MVIDHIGIVVKSIDEGIKRWETFFDYKQMTEIVINSIQNVKVVFLHKSGSLVIKLIQPIDDSSPVFMFAKKGGGIHHLCFRCDNLNNEIERMKGLGLRILTEPQSGEAFCNEKIAFIYAKEGLNIELIETDLKYGLL
jgi:methylmalonyl-CoA/ethylmalonyl-CoA epimerase